MCYGCCQGFKAQQRWQNGWTDVLSLLGHSDLCKAASAGRCCQWSSASLGRRWQPIIIFSITGLLLHHAIASLPCWACVWSRSWSWEQRAGNSLFCKTLSHNYKYTSSLQVFFIRYILIFM